MLKMDYIRHKELEKMTRIKAGVSAEVERRLQNGHRLEELLKQLEGQPAAMEDQVIMLYALSEDFFADTPPADVRKVLEQLIKQIRTTRPDLIDDLVAKKELTDEIKEGLNEQFARCHSSL